MKLHRVHLLVAIVSFALLTLTPLHAAFGVIGGPNGERAYRQPGGKFEVMPGPNQGSGGKPSSPPKPQPAPINKRCKWGMLDAGTQILNFDAGQRVDFTIFNAGTGFLADVKPISGGAFPDSVGAKYLAPAVPGQSTQQTWHFGLLAKEPAVYKLQITIPVNAPTFKASYEVKSNMCG
jgi:hypothetical protein